MYSFQIPTARPTRDDLERAPDSIGTEESLVCVRGIGPPWIDCMLEKSASVAEQRKLLVLTFAVNDSESIGGNIVVAKCIHSRNIRHGRDDEVLSWWVRLP